MIDVGNYLWAYMYMRKLAHKSADLCYSTILKEVHLPSCNVANPPHGHGLAE